MLTSMPTKPRVLSALMATLALMAVALAPAWGQTRVSPATAPTTQSAKEPGANPLYEAWKNQAGKTVTFSRSEQISGGAPTGGARPPTTTPVQFALTELTADQAVLKVTAADGAPETLTIPAKFQANASAQPKAAGTEELKIGNKTYACTKYTYSTTSKAEIGRDPQGLSAQVTVWLAEGVPGGVVKRHITLTIRASYDITDTLKE